VHNLHLKDYFTLENSLTGNIGAPTRAVMSFKVVWNATGSVNHYNNRAQKFRGNFRDASGQIEYSGRAGHFEFQSAPLASSTTVIDKDLGRPAAELGRESNGLFY
jgi:hypothetical protein